MCGLNKQDLQGPKRKDKHCGKLLPSICKKSRNVNHLDQEKCDVCQHLTFSPAVTTFLIKILRLGKSHVDVPMSHAKDLRIEDDQNVVLEGFQRTYRKNCSYKVQPWAFVQNSSKTSELTGASFFGPWSRQHKTLSAGNGEARMRRHNCMVLFNIQVLSLN